MLNGDGDKAAVGVKIVVKGAVAEVQNENRDGDSLPIIEKAGGEPGVSLLEEAESAECSSTTPSSESQPSSISLTSDYKKKLFKCDVCSSTFTKSQSLENHMMIHTGLKPFKCETCPSAFRKRSQFDSHMIMHKGIKPFKCDVCLSTLRRFKNTFFHSTAATMG